MGPEEHLFNPGEENNKLYILISGRIILFSQSRKSDREEVINNVEEIEGGKLIGVKSFFSGGGI